MNNLGIDLSLVWAAIILFGVMMYVVMDGFDLGIGLLYPFFPNRGDRDVMMNTVAPVWDGNETWLVMGGAGLFAAFPLAYGLILSALYLPLILMLLGLIFRGVAFEFRFRASELRRHWWDYAFIGGSVCATFFQGVALGALISGIEVSGRSYGGGPFDWLTPFALFCGVSLLFGYALLGCTWLVYKTDGPLQVRMRRFARPLTLLLLGVVGLISIWTPLQHAAIATRWFSFPNVFWLAPVPLLVLLTTWRLLESLKGEGHATPFILTLCLVFLAYSGLGISVWPHVVPPSITIWDAAAPVQSQLFTLIGALLIIPMILGYTAWSYYVFRGKVDSSASYH